MNHAMRQLVFFTSLPNVGGHTTISLGIVRLLQSSFDRILVISREMPGHGTSTEALETLAQAGVETLLLKGNRIQDDISRLAYILRHGWTKPAVFLAMGMRHRSPVLSLFLRPKRSVYYHITHELTPKVSFMLRCYSRCFSTIAFISPATEQQWLKGTKPASETCSIVQPIGIDLSHVVSHQLCGAIRFGFIGRLNEGKGCETLREFVRNCKTQCVLRVAGSGDYSQAFEELSHQRSFPAQVQFDGPFSSSQRSEFLSSFFADIDYLVVPSQDDREGLPTVILEALSAGVPVIATRTGGMRAFSLPEFSCPTSKCVTLVEKEEVGATLETLARLPRPTQSLASECRQYFDDRFSDRALLEHWQRALAIL